MLKKILIALAVFDLLAVSGAVGYLFWRGADYFGARPVADREIEVREVVRNEGGNVYVDRCGQECKEAIKAEVESYRLLVASSPTGTLLPSVKPAAKVVAKKVRREEILTIPGSGSVAASEWTDISGTHFYFDSRDYPGITEVYFEANMRLVNGNGYGYVRLFDQTNAIAVVGGENNTNSQTDVWTKSQRVNFWQGRNLIRVQAKSLTADTTVYNLGRLRIITEN